MKWYTCELCDADASPQYQMKQLGPASLMAIIISYRVYIVLPMLHMSVGFDLRALYVLL